jgi:hypothetical protein
MNKILFILLVASVSFSGIQGAFATKVQKDEDNSNMNKRPLRVIHTAPKPPVMKFLRAKMSNGKNDRDCTLSRSVRKPSTKLAGKEDLVQEKQGGTVMKPLFIPGFRFQRLINCADQEYKLLLSEKEEQSGLPVRIQTPQNPRKSFIKMQLQHGKIINIGNKEDRAYVNKNGIICVVPKIIISFHD